MSNKTILLVEDDPDDEELTRKALTEAGVVNRVDVVHTGAEALEHLLGTGDRPGLDPAQMPELVLLDLKLPKLSGLQVLERLRADPRTRLLPVVILTTSAEEEDILTSYQLGANSYVRKPIEFERFAEAIRLVGLYWLVVNQPPPLKP